MWIFGIVYFTSSQVICVSGCEAVCTEYTNRDKEKQKKEKYQINDLVKEIMSGESKVNADSVFLSEWRTELTNPNSIKY